MASCDKINSGRLYETLCYSAGIKEIGIGNYSDYVSSTVSNDKISHITAAGTVSPLFYKHEIEPETASFKYTSDNVNGAYSNAGELVVKFIGNNTPNLMNTDQLVRNRSIIYIVDINDKVWILGRTFGCKAKGDVDWGIALNDVNGQTLTFTVREKDRIYEVASYSIISALL